MIRIDELLTPSPAGRQAHREQVIRALMIEPASQLRVAVRTGLSQPTVCSLVHELEREGIVVIQRPRGQRGQLVRLAPVAAVVAGVAVGPRQVTVALRRADQQEPAFHTMPVGLEYGQEQWLEACAAGIIDQVGRLGMGLWEVLSVGLALPADHSAATLTACGPAEALAERLETTVLADQDTNLAALAEHLYGDGRDVDSLLYVKTGTCVGAGIVQSGRVWRGAAGTAGEIGHISLNPAGPDCRCGSRGCLEALVSEPALLEQIRHAHRGRHARLPTSLPDLIQQAKDGNACCLGALHDAGGHLGLALATACNLLNPNLITVGGDLAHAGEVLMGPLRATLDRYALPAAVKHDGLRLAASTLREPEAVGALAYGLDLNASTGVPPARSRHSPEPGTVRAGGHAETFWNADTQRQVGGRV